MASPNSSESPWGEEVQGASAPGAAQAQCRTAASDGVGILHPEHWTQQGHKVEGNAVSAYTGGGNAGSTHSLSSSILEYRTVHGRTYHSERGSAHYWGSNDDQHNEALDILHHVNTLALDTKLFMAPLRKDIQRVIDIGTGTGIWAIDFADEFPETEVIGTDISPIQPDLVPPNLRFEMEDCTQDWTFDEDSFDYVHIRWLLGSIADWTAFFKEAYRCLGPGGYLESQEPAAKLESDDGTLKETSAMGQWGRLFIEGSMKTGRPFTVVSDNIQVRAMQAAGFVDIQECNVKIPIGDWPRDPKMRELGQYEHFAFEKDIEGWIIYMADTLGWKKEAIHIYSAQIRQELRNPSTHGYFRQKIVWGRKPQSDARSL